MPQKKKIISKIKKTPRVSVPAVQKEEVRDVLPRDGAIWREAIQTFFSVAEIHAFHYIETAPFEQRKIFSFYEGEYGKKPDDILFTFAKGGLVLRPEAPVPLLRAYAENHLGHFSSPLKIFHFLQVARKDPHLERTTFHEAGFHILGDTEPFYDIQVISAAMDLLKTFKIRDAVIRVNANGCRNCRAVYREKLKRFIASKRGTLKAHTLKMIEKSPENIFSLGESERDFIDEAPTLLDHLCPNCNNHFRALLELLEDNEIPYEPDPRFLLPVERWNRVVFEIRAKSQRGGYITLFRGGRYDHLAETTIARQIPAVGVIAYPEELVRFVRDENIPFHTRQRSKVFFIVVGDKAKKVSVRLMNTLRAAGVIVEETLGKQSFKAQLKGAEKSKAAYVLIVGQKEAFEDTVIIRNIESGAQETITTHNLSEEVKRRLKAA
jgi:histidyl-tRNA synthetase